MTLANLSLWGTKSDISTAVKTVNKFGTTILGSEDEYGYDIIDYLTMNDGRGKKRQKTMLTRFLPISALRLALTALSFCRGISTSSKTKRRHSKFFRCS